MLGIQSTQHEMCLIVVLSVPPKCRTSKKEREREKKKQPTASSKRKIASGVILHNLPAQKVAPTVSNQSITFE